MHVLAKVCERLLVLLLLSLAVRIGHCEDVPSTVSLDCGASITATSTYPGKAPLNVLLEGEPWLAQNNPAFPVVLSITLPTPQRVDALELTQTAWPTGDYRTGRYELDLSDDGRNWIPLTAAQMPNQPSARMLHPFTPRLVRGVRVRILDSHDVGNAGSCGLGRVRLLVAGAPLAIPWVAELQNKLHGPPLLIPDFDFRAVKSGTVRDHLWVWSHTSGAYNGGAWNTPGESHIEPLNGAAWLGLPNMIFIRYLGQPRPPLAPYAHTLEPLKRLYWQPYDNNGNRATMRDIEDALQIVATQPNVVGLFLDDFFFVFQSDSGKQWLAEKNTRFPVELQLTLPRALPATHLRIEQSNWVSPDYRARDLTVEASPDGTHWLSAGHGTLTDDPDAALQVELHSAPCKAFRIQILNGWPHGGAQSVGLRRLRLLDSGLELPLSSAQITASSQQPEPQYAPASLLTDVGKDEHTAPAALSQTQLRHIRTRLDQIQQRTGRSLSLGGCCFTYQFNDIARIKPIMDLWDKIVMFTWKESDLPSLEQNLQLLKSTCPGKEIWLGLYLYDFGEQKPMSVAGMQRQCEQGLQWLKAGQIQGMVFLGVNVLDRNLDAAQWTRDWIAKVADQPL